MYVFFTPVTLSSYSREFYMERYFSLDLQKIQANHACSLLEIKLYFAL